MIGFDWLCAWVYAFCFIVSASVIQIHGSNDTYDRIYEGENLSPRANQAECAKERHTRQVFSDSDTTTNRGGGTLKQMYRNFNEDFPGGLPGTLSTLSRNRSLSLDLQTPVNSTVYEEHHIYYNVSFVNDASTKATYFVDMDRYNDSVVSHEGLSKSHLKAAGISLSFAFPFYGYKLNNLTLATGGFLYTGNPDHSWIAATQYIAPLMADFDFLQRNDSSIRYFDNGTALTIEWKNAVLHEKPEVGPFTFQCTLRDDGAIIFYYRKVPIPIADIPNETHPVKVGVSDAYMIDRQRFIIRYRTIYEYHRIALNNGSIVNDSALILKALPTCISYSSCETCLRSKAVPGCMWCDAVQRCSDGVDRFHQEWYTAQCHLTAMNQTCSATSNPPAVTTKMTVKLTKPLAKPLKNGTVEGTSRKAGLTDMSEYSTSGRNRTPPSTEPSSSFLEKSKYTLLDRNSTNSAAPMRMQMASYQSAQPVATGTTTTNYAVAIAAVLVVATLGTVLGWVVYAYLRPQTTSGQWLIKYRPNQWRRSREDEIQIANTAF